ncbi:MAG: HNH endonuclease [Actinomycetaceae bacterium]|nr:HNH endonuclease [Arcanobacterium sp.]MDD7505565.1 HNH endonuclease [Actinomycetaceae bacterium]MDY6143816.1 HNH endonuclease [Arcanobacterium sp.]
MPTSRTGTARHKHFRRTVLTRDHQAGITHCPLCGIILDYEHPGYPNSAEADHIIPARWGGTDTPTNGQTICRRCNQRKKDKLTPQARTTRALNTTTDIAW